MSTPYQLAVIADGAVSYVPGDELSGPIHDIVQGITNNSSSPAPSLGNSSLSGLSTAMGMVQATSPTSQIAFLNPIASAQVPTISVECWISSTDTVPVAAGALSKAAAIFSDTVSFGQNDWGLGFSGAMIPQWFKGHPGTGNDDVIAGSALNDGAWHYIVATWDGVAGTAQLYVDSVLIASASSWYQGTTGGDGHWWSGDNGGGFTGNINNIALYPGILSPTQIANHYFLGVTACDPNFGDVSLLLPFDGSIVDTSANNLPFTLHGATTESSQVLFGSGALNLPQASAYATTPNTPGGPLDISAGVHWTIESYVYLDISTNPTGNGLELWGATDLQSNPAWPSLTAGNQSGTIVVSQGFSGAGLHGPVTPNTWTHVATTFDGVNVTLWVAGINVASIGIGTGMVAGSAPFFVGPFDFNPGDPQAIIGFMDELRFTKGLARYTANFTPAAAPFPSVACVGLIPDVVGLSDPAAQSAITAAFYGVGTISTVDSPAAPGTVISQSPVGGTSAAIGTSVDLVESIGLVVPDVVNTSATVVAPGIITDAGFVVGAIVYAPDVLTIPGNVISQNPAAGSFAAGGSPINLVVSTGRAGLLVPLILFLTEAEAIDALVSIGLVPGGISFAPSTTFAAGEVMAQNPSAGNPIAYGGIVGFVVSTGTHIVSSLFDTGPTVISQYANSPTLLQWISNMNLYIDQSVNFAKFLAYVWNVNTAVGFGLDIWGRIVNVSRLLQIPNTTLYVGFDNGTRSPSDWEPLGSNQPGGGGIGALYSGHNATQAYLLDDDAYRQLILAKAFANICATTAPALNQILQNLYGANNAWVLNTGTMSISYNFRFRPSPVQLAILQQSGVIPTPPGVSVTIVSP